MHIEQAIELIKQEWGGEYFRSNSDPMFGTIEGIRQQYETSVMKYAPGGTLASMVYYLSLDNTSDSDNLSVKIQRLTIELG